MILQASQTIIEFNGGDIAVGYGTKDGIGKIMFQDLEEKQEIGTKVENSNYIFPVIFEFNKEESIDIVIKQLQSLKEQMKEKAGK